MLPPGAFAEGTKFVEASKAHEGRVLVHCMHGVNRSATVAIAILMNLEKMTLNDAYYCAKERRSLVKLWRGNKEKIASWEKSTTGECTLSANDMY